ncbi:MAG: beta-lactamase family protein, partial [Acidimicrobiia bacterium]|nr:beta-lactamase family protein [Acidimicrobiia bacterium]
MSRNEISSRLQRLVDRQVASASIHNAIAGIATADGRLHIAAAGFADPNRTLPMTGETPYFLASITKMYTATLVMKLAELGKLDLKAPISAYLPSGLVEGIHVLAGT